MSRPRGKSLAKRPPSPSRPDAAAATRAMSTSSGPTLEIDGDGPGGRQAEDNVELVLD